MRNLTFLFVVLTIFNVTSAKNTVVQSEEVKCQPIGSSTSATISFTVTSKDDPPPKVTGLVMLFDFGEDSFTVEVPDYKLVLGQVYNYTYTKEYKYKKNGIFKTRIGREKLLVGGKPYGGNIRNADMLMKQDNCVYGYVLPTQTPSQTPTAAPSAAPSSQMMHWFPILLISFMMTCALI